MTTPRKYEWTPEMIAALGTDTDDAISKKLGIPKPSVYSKRRRLGIPPSAAKVYRLSVEIDEPLRQKIEEIEPLLARRMREAGMPVRQLEAWQVIEVALNELIKTVRKSEVKKLYAVAPVPSEGGHDD